MLAELLLIATCTLEPATTFTPPEGWTLTRVIASGRDNTCEHASCLSIVPRVVAHTTVTLERGIQLGETVQAPKDKNCTLTSTLTHPRKD